ncbi:hypothetical protein [Tautonia sociabilis]|uniref:Uncharacterized protein n=1 Tax=Tautonia sociabilis TaxID=2080755 RepID=A0A432MNC2_9BACT|nr:hypothetical protein [Tautonia sociabilis]RUL88800.1 hypothetical protein TsocGM_05435 [Tautonia sociabilis]
MTEVPALLEPDAEAPPPGEELRNPHPHPVRILIHGPGQVRSWWLADADGDREALAAPFVAGQMLVLGPGERIGIDSEAAPRWRWLAGT